MASHPTQPNEQRRRLLKAASAAPVIFTLPVGSSVAARSVMCENHDGNVKTVSTGNDENIDNGSLDNGSIQDSKGNWYTPHSDDYVYIHDGQQYVLTNDNQLITRSCWGSMRGIASASSSSTNIV